MKSLLKIIYSLVVCFSLAIVTSSASASANQTNQLSPIMPASGLPFRVTIEQASFQLPVGIHSGVAGVYNGLWIFIAGRTNGLHGFGPDPFPVESQNTSIYVVNPTTGQVSSRSLTDPSSGLNQQQIDTLSVTSPQSYQEGNTLYMTGGYGIDTSTGTFGTKPVLTTINLPGIVKWVMEPSNKHYSVVQNIRQLYHPVFQISGGKMHKVGNMTQLIFGQNFSGVYSDSSNGSYSEQVRRFQIITSGGRLAVNTSFSLPHSPDANYRRRDLNIVPVIMNNNNRFQYGNVAYAGVFTEGTGVWTVPVVIGEAGLPNMADPNSPTTFKQAMNQYVCATAGLYSRKNMSMYNIFFGGISYGYYQNGIFETDAEIPFINEVTTIKMDKNGSFTQYLMDNQYPTILSTQTNPGNILLFGAGAYFIPTKIPQYSNGVIGLDNIQKPTVIGYIVGGIQSTLPNTNVDADSSASSYIFKVTLVPTH